MPIIPDEKSKVTPSVFQAIMLDEIANGIRELTSLIKQTIPEGIVETYEETATTSQTIIRPPAGKKWISVSIFNKGDATAKLGINVGYTNAITVEKNKSFNVDTKVPKITEVNYKTESGTANLVIICIR